MHLNRMDPDIVSIIDQASAPVLWALAHALKARRHIALSLDIIDRLLQRHETFVYTYYGDILLFRAVLLSDDRFKRWDDAIHILRILDESIGYTRRNVEVVTLLGSNHKRKGVYDQQGNLKDTLDEEAKELIATALGYYNDAYQLRTDSSEKYYDLVNIFYLHKMLECRDLPRDYQKRSPTILQLDMENCTWWEFISYCELHVLAGNDAPADWLEKRTQMPTCDEYHITKRQMDIYRRFCQKDALFNDFYNAYIKKYKAVCK